jgi:hypothetical protein
MRREIIMTEPTLTTTATGDLHIRVVLREDSNTIGSIIDLEEAVASGQVRSLISWITTYTEMPLADIRKLKATQLEQLTTSIRKALDQAEPPNE